MAEPKKLPRYPSCFICGRENPAGLNLTFYATEEMVYTELEIAERYIGFADRAHGGIAAAIVDETMGWSCTTKTGRMYYTSELRVKFKRPVPVKKPVRVEGICSSVKRWIARAEGRIVGPDGRVCVEADGVYCAVPGKSMDEILSYLEIDTPQGKRSAQAGDIVL